MKHTGLDKDYRRLHYWVERQLGKPSLCSKCKTNKAKRFDWANVSGEYKQEVTDWIRLCRSCHLLTDKSGNTGKGYRTKGKCKRGHLTTATNTYTSPTNGKQYCVECRKLLRHQYYLTKRVVA